jgi:thioredoxin reductase (NADPH)
MMMTTMHRSAVPGRAPSSSSLSRPAARPARVPSLLGGGRSATVAAAAAAATSRASPPLSRHPLRPLPSPPRAGRATPTPRSKIPRTPRAPAAPLTPAEAALPVETTRVAVVGSGPAAHSAAIYLARAELQPLVLEGTFNTASGLGGQLITTTIVENYPGFPGGIQGYELTERFRAQSEEHGAQLIGEKVYRVDFSRAAFGGPKVLFTEEEPGVPKRRIEADAVIIATGAAARRLPIPGAHEGEGGYWQKGVSACAVCDGALFRGGKVAVIGGGDTAMEEAMFLSRFTEEVTVIHRFAKLEASKVMARRAKGNPKIKILFESEVERLEGDGESLQRAVVKDNSAAGAGKTHDLAIDALFFGVGHSPCVEFLDGQLRLDEAGYIWTAPDSTATNVPGVFAAGDVCDRKWRQAITAAGSGCMAALEAERRLANLQSAQAGASVDLVEEEEEEQEQEGASLAAGAQR